jgi:hypothetical protein
MLVHWKPLYNLIDNVITGLMGSNILTGIIDKKFASPNIN